MTWADAWAAAWPGGGGVFSIEIRTDVKSNPFRWVCGRAQSQARQAFVHKVKRQHLSIGLTEV